MPISVRPGAAFALLALLSAARAFAQDSSLEPLRGEFWTELEPIAAPGETWPVPLAEAERRLRAEAVWSFAGMIFGFEFEYVPSDRVRGLAERFELRELGSLEPEALVGLPAARSATAGTLRSGFEYGIDLAAAAAMEGYASDPWKPAQGLGSADVLGGNGARRDACVDALRAALRELLRSLEPNKPRLVKGRVVLARPPSIVVADGSYRALVRARAMVVESIPYRVY